MMEEAKTACRAPARARDGVTNIPTWKYEAVRDAGAEGLAFKEVSGEVKSRLTADDPARLGSAVWHVTSVKLNMEVEGELVRLEGRGQQRLTVA